MLLSPYFFLFGLTSFFMTNTLILHVSCVYFLSSFSLFCVSSYGLGTYIGHPTAQRSHVDCNQLHARKMPASSDSTHDSLFAVLAWGLTPHAAGWNPRTNLELLGELLKACLWGDLSHHHCFTRLKKKMCSKTIASDLIDFLP